MAELVGTFSRDLWEKFKLSNSEKRHVIRFMREMAEYYRKPMTEGGQLVYEASRAKSMPKHSLNLESRNRVFAVMYIDRDDVLHIRTRYSLDVSPVLGEWGRLYNIDTPEWNTYYGASSSIAMVRYYVTGQIDAKRMHAYTDHWKSSTYYFRYRRDYGLPVVA